MPMMEWERDVSKALRQRGLTVDGFGDPRSVLVPAGADGLLDVEDPAGLDGLAQRWASRAFRKVARALLKERDQWAPLGTLHQWASPKKSAEHLAFLNGAGVVDQTDAGVRYVGWADNIGPTLEWCVARLCRAELGGAAARGVRLATMPEGTDCDVLAVLGGQLIYIECKAKSYKDIANDELETFFRRRQFPAPDLAVLLVDTDEAIDRLLDRMNTFLDARLRTADEARRAQEAGDRFLWKIPAPMSNIAGGWGGVMLANTEPSIAGQLRDCLLAFNRHLRSRTMLG
jgi:hypothetical protein